MSDITSDDLYSQCGFCGYFHWAGSKNCYGLNGSDRSKEAYNKFCRQVREESIKTGLKLGLVKPHA
jgi:hypothetical protein